MALLLILFLLSSSLGYTTGQNSFLETDDDSVIACFLDSWSLYRDSHGKFDISDVDTALCTHLVYCYMTVNEQTFTIMHLDSYIEELGQFERLGSLKEMNPNLKVTVAVGGWDQGSVRFSNLAASRNARRVFIESTVDFLTKYNLDGLVIDWRDPATRGGTPADKDNFVYLCRELRTEFQKHGWQLTITLSARTYQIEVGFDLYALSDAVDYFYLLTMDYHGPWDGFTGHSAPLHQRSSESGAQAKLNVNFTLSYLLAEGVSPNKLVLGLYFLGSIYRLASSTEHDFGAPSVTNNDFTGPYSQTLVRMGYNEVCELHKAGGWTVMWHDEHKVPYIYHNDKWISYSDTESISATLDEVEKRKLRGVFVWTISADDFDGHCSGKKYPLLQHVNDKMKLKNQHNNKPTTVRPPAVLCVVEAQNRNPNEAYLRAVDIDTNLCTHVVFCFAKINRTLDISFVNNIFNDPEELLSAIVQLKASKPSLKVTVGIGGSSEQAALFAQVTSTRKRRARFIHSIIRLIREYRLDGIDLNWPEPGRFGEGDKNNYAYLCQELHHELHDQKVYLSVFVSGSVDDLTSNYNLRQLNSFVDYFYIEAYNLEKSLSKTGHGAPMLPRHDQPSNERNNNVKAFVAAIIAIGVPPSKLVFGVNLYGRRYTLENSSNHNFGAPTVPFDDFRRLGDMETYITYKEICTLLQLEGVRWTRMFHPEHMVPYIFRDKKWITYEDTHSLNYKLNLAESFGFAGVLVWSINSDDFSGQCSRSHEAYPLLASIYKRVRSHYDQGIEENVAPVISCFLETWSLYRLDDAFFISDTDVSLCTHILYCFAGLNESSFEIMDLDPYTTREGKGYENVARLKTVNNKLKTLIAIGGWNDGSVKYSKMVSNPTHRQRFISSVIEFLRETRFDGVVLNWMDPSTRGGSPDDRQNFVILCQEMKQAFLWSGYTLSVAMNGRIDVLRVSYDIPALSRIVDYLYLLSYNYHGHWDRQTGHTSPLFHREIEDAENRELNVNSALRYVLAEGVLPSKLLLGITFTGRTFEVYDDTEHGLNVPSKPIKDLLNDGQMGYNEICKSLKSKLWYAEWISEQKVPYMYKGSHWVGFENVSSILIKMDYVKSYKLRGVVIWTISNDDFKGICDQGRYPLLSAVNAGLGRLVVKPSDNAGSVHPGSWCSVSVSEDIEVELLQCGSSGNKCAKNGLWKGYEENYIDDDIEDAKDGVQFLCQPSFVNSPICGRTIRYKSTGAELDVHEFFEPKNTWSWIAVLSRLAKDSCLATVITNSHLLTAAHCVTSSIESSTATADLEEIVVKVQGSEERQVSAIILHPDYRAEKNRFVNDIAIIVLKHPLLFSSKMYPACVYFGDRLLHLPAAAFEAEVYGKEIFPTLSSLIVDSDCSMTSAICPVQVLKTQYCAVNETTIFDLHEGSSGGPLIQNYAREEGEDRWFVTGLVSYRIRNFQCQRNVAVFTAVNPFKGWIKNTIYKLF